MLMMGRARRGFGAATPAKISEISIVAITPQPACRAAFPRSSNKENNRTIPGTKVGPSTVLPFFVDGIPRASAL
jgi:hypothetical protein